MPRDPFHKSWRPPRAWHVEAMEATLPALRDGQSPLLAVCTGAGKTDWTCHAAWLAAVDAGGYHGAVILVPTEALVEQTYQAMQRRATCDGTIPPLCTVGRWYGRRQEADRDVVVCCYPSLPSLAMEWAMSGRRPHLLIIDEAHGSEAPRVREAIAALDARRMVGLTATPYRAAPGERLGLFSGVAYSYDYHRAVSDGVLVPRRVVPWTGDTGSLDDVTLAMLEQHAPRRDGRIWRTVVDADSIDDAEALAERLTGEGIRSEAVHSRMGRADVLLALARLERGATDVITHCNLLSEGVDLPWLRCYLLRQRTGSRNRLVQRVGRVLRPDPRDPSKDCGLILDVWRLCRTVGLDHEADLGESDEPRTSPDDGMSSIRDWRKQTEQEKRERVVEAMSAAEVWAEQLRLALEDAGLCDPPRYDGGAWRTRPATVKQRQTIAQMRRFAQYLPHPKSRDLLRAIADAPDLTSGAASDIIAALGALRSGSVEARRAKRYAPVDVEVPDGPAIQRTLDFQAREPCAVHTSPV